MAIAAGRFRHRLWLEELVEVTDSNGDPVFDESTGQRKIEWRKVRGVWAAIEPLSAREFVRSREMQSEVKCRIVIRYMEGIDASMRFVQYRNNRPSRYFNITGVLEDIDYGTEYLTLPCTEGVNDG